MFITVCTVFCLTVPSSRVNALSGTYYFTTNSYGSFSYGIADTGTNISSTMNAMEFQANFNGIYNGRITINFSNTLSSTTYLIPINCYIYSKSTQSIVISFTNQSQIFLLFADVTNNYALNVQSVITNSMTKVTDGTNKQLSDIYSRLGTIMYNIGDIYELSLPQLHGDLNTINNRLTTLQSYLYVSAGGPNQISIAQLVKYIKDNSDLLVSQTDGIEISLDNILTAINNINTNTQTDIDIVNDFGDLNYEISNIIEDLNINIDDNIPTLNTYLTALDSKITGFLNNGIGFIRKNIFMNTAEGNIFYNYGYDILLITLICLFLGVLLA